MDNLSGAHTRYNIQYHFVWIVKYRQDLLYDQSIQKKLKETLCGIGARYEFDVNTVGTDGNHVHLFLRAAPRCAPSEIMNIIKSISAIEMFKAFPHLRDTLWGGELWGDGYYVGTVGDGVTIEIIQRYIANQGRETGHKNFNQMTLF